MIAVHYGRHYTLDHLREQCFIGREGVSLLGISKAAEQIGFRTVGKQLTFDKLAKKALLPCVILLLQLNQAAMRLLQRFSQTAERCCQI